MLPRMGKSKGRGLLIGANVVAIVLSLMMCSSATFKFIQHPGPVASIHGVVGVPLSLFPVLGGLLLAGAVGLIVGIFKPAIGVAAGAGLVLYFVGAVIAHIWVGDFSGLKGPIVPLLLSITALTLRFLSMRRERASL